nr:hypothetical protein BaRGS_034175 [Batillaria attramentaria]
MLVLATQRSLWQVHNIFIANLAVADLFVVTSGLPFMLLDLLWEKNPLQDEPDVCSVSLLSMLSISFNRYVKVCRTNLFHKLFSVKRTFAFCATLWMFAGTVNTIMALADQLHGYHNVSHICTLRGQGHRKFGSIVMSVHLIVPNSRTRSRNIIINIAINTNSITDVVTETATTVPRPATPWPASHESAVVRSLVAISICVTLFCTPLAICVLVDLAENVPSDVMVAACMMLFVNCTVNWIIYGVMNTSFRKAYVRTLRLCIKRKPVSYPFF